jgi:hypothetical protein
VKSDTAHSLILPKDAEKRVGVLTETPFVHRLIIRRRKYKREQELLIAKAAKKGRKGRKEEVLAGFLRGLCGLSLRTLRLRALALNPR